MSNSKFIKAGESFQDFDQTTTGQFYDEFSSSFLHHKDLKPDNILDIQTKTVPNITRRTKPSETPFETSPDYEINESGELFENWDVTETWPAKLIEVNNDFVLLECLIDYQNKEYSLRQFPRAVMEGKIPFRFGTFVIIKVFMRPGKQVFEYEHDFKAEYKKYFETDNSDIDSIRIGKLK
jgi:hypothetical protein